MQLRFAVAASLLTVFAANANAQIEYPVNFRIGVQTAGTKRDVSVDSVVGQRSSASVRGVEMFLAPAVGGVGIGGRLLDGNYAGEKYSLKEGRLFLGESWFRIEVAYGERSLQGSDSTYLFTKAGAGSVVQIGGVGVTLSIRGSKYLKGNFTKNNSVTPDPDGWEGETDIFYTAPRLPIFVQLGYRSEYFKVGVKAEHMSGVIFGTGLWLGGR